MSKAELNRTSVEYYLAGSTHQDTWYTVDGGRRWFVVDDVDVFIDDISYLKRKSRFGAAVHVYTAEEYKGFRLFQNSDGSAGFAIKPDGDLVSVYSNGGGVLPDLVAVAVALGATKLDCFDGRLVELYSALGFREVGRVQWDDQYQPEGWDKALLGTPDVVYMEYAPE